jgi:hypothetical protein
MPARREKRIGTGRYSNFCKEERGASRLAQVIQYQPSKCEALSSNPSTTPTQKKRKKSGGNP